MLKEILLKLKNVLISNSVEIRNEQFSIFLLCLGDLYFMENDYNNCLRFYLDAVRILKKESLSDFILKRMFYCLNALNLFTAGAVVYQFLNLPYDQQLLKNLKSLDRIWLPYFYDLNYLEIFYFQGSQKDLISKLMSCGNQQKQFKSKVSTIHSKLEGKVFSKITSLFKLKNTRIAI
jgi:hypothetical protein